MYDYYLPEDALWGSRVPIDGPTNLHKGPVDDSQGTECLPAVNDSHRQAFEQSMLWLRYG